MKYFDRVWMLIAGWIIIPLGLLINCILIPSFWVLRYGWDNTPFFHNVRAGYHQILGATKDAWKIEE